MSNSLSKQLFERLSQKPFSQLESEIENFVGISGQSKNILKKNIMNLDRFKAKIEKLHSDGIELYPYYSAKYPSVFMNLPRLGESVPFVFALGNYSLLYETLYGVVGRRDATQKSLSMAKRLAHSFSQKHTVTVSGFARGVDKAALDSAMFHKGSAIMLLPEGIYSTTKKIEPYKKYIDDGRLLFLSTAYPSAPFNSIQANIRNSQIYALSEKIFIPETGSSGGTWNGAIEGLRKGADIYVRMPEGKERNANRDLIFMGATPVDKYGNVVADTISQTFFHSLFEIIEANPTSADEIKKRLKLKLSPNIIRKKIEGHPEIRIVKKKGKKMYFIDNSLFSSKAGY
ncbi:MAG: DNA-processing protein DprA [Candidatus Zixiibacteriota bacterium]